MSLFSVILTRVACFMVACVAIMMFSFYVEDETARFIVGCVLGLVSQMIASEIIDTRSL